MKKIYRFLLEGVLAFSALTGAVFAYSNSEVYEAEAAQKVSHSVTSKYIYDNSTTSEEGWGFDLNKDGLFCSLNMYKRSVSSESSLSTMGFNIYVTRANDRIPDAKFQKIRKLKVSFKVSDISESQTNFRYSIYKTNFAESNRLFFRENQPKSTTTVYTAEVDVDGTDTSINQYILDINAYSFRFLATDLTFEVYSYVEEYPVTISAGTGISSVFLSTNENATSGSASGTNFEKGSTVYGFVTLKDGYNSNPDWTNVSGNVYRIGSKTNLAKAEDFGTINAPSTISYDIAYELDGGSITGTNPTSYDVESESFTLINPTKTGYTFAGWSGTGIAGTSDSVTISKGSTGNRSYTANWTANQYIITYLDGGSSSVYSGNNIDDLVKTHTYNTITNLVAGVKPGNVFGGWFDNSECTGNAITSIGKTDYTEDFTLYAKWIVKEAVQDAMDKINAIGEVSYPDSGEAINTAREAYDALPIEDQGGVKNYSLLTAAETEYENQKIAGVNNVKDLIDAIGEVEYTETCKGKIDAARNAYDALTAEQKELVDPSLVQDLENAETEYKALDDQHKADEVKGLINAIGEVEYTETCKGKIDAARNAYDALTTEQKELITAEEYKVLTDAEAAYKALDDAAKAAVVKALIDDIGEVVYTDECKTKIDAANNAYEALTEAQKELVTNKQVLFDAIELYNTLAHQPEVHDNGVQVKGKDGELIPVNITVKVEIKTTVEAEQGTTAYENIQKALGNNQKIAVVYDIKLMRTIGDQVTEIQPSDIKAGMVIIIEITLPDELNVEGLKVLHIHGENDISYIENFKIDAGKLSFETDRLSEIAFAVPAPVTSLPGWAIALIVIGGILLGLLFFLIIMFIFFSKYIIVQHKRKVVRAIKIRTKNTLVVLLGADCKTYKRPKELVYKTKEEALKVLNK